MKKLFFLSLVFVMLFSGAAFAGGTGSGTVSAVQIWDSGWVTFGTTSRNSNPCPNDYFTFDAKTVAGKAMLAVLLTAQTNGKSIVVWGTGTCGGDFGDRELAGMINE